MRSFPWDSLVVSMGDDGFPIYDRDYRASDLREVYQTFFSNGVFLDTPNAFQVTAGEGMNVLVATGKCCINGTVGYESSTRTLALQASSSQDRIDTVVLRWNANVETRSIDLYVKTGTAAATPTAPSLTRSETVYELGLADIFVTKNSGAISAARITDTRLNTSRCGVVTPLININTESIYETLNAALQELEEELKDQTQIAVELAQSALDGTTAGHLQNQIDGKVSKSGDTMTGQLKSEFNQTSQVVNFIFQNRFSDEFIRKNYIILKPNDDGSVFVNEKNGAVLNWFSLGDSSTRLKNPLAIDSGGTGATTAANARVNIGAIGAKVGTDSVWGLTEPNGGDVIWIRAPKNGFLPFDKTNTCHLGSSGGWEFADAYIKQIFPLGSSYPISDYIVDMGNNEGYNGGNYYISWTKYNSGKCWLFISHDKNGAGTSSGVVGFSCPLPFTIYNPKVTSAVWNEGNSNCYPGYSRATNTEVQGYMLNATTAYKEMDLFIYANWK